MNFSDLLSAGFQLELRRGNPDSGISLIFSDSRQAGAGDIFCVYEDFGEKTPDYLNSCFERGVRTVLMKEDSDFLSIAEKFENLILTKEDPRELHGPIAHFISGEPSLSLRIVAVTGTNGKTSVTHILFDLFSGQGKKCGLIGTINVKYNGKTIETGYTTPDPTTLNLILKDMKSAGVEFVFIEASSHGLKLGRLNGIHLHSVVFTNQTLDHMDFHPDMDDYRRSKFRLFQLLENSVHQEKFALVSLDSPGGQEMRTLVERENFHYPVFYFGKSADYSGENVTLSLTGTSYEIHKASENKSVKIETNLLGNYNYINTAMAYIVCEKSGISSESVCVDLKNISYVNGRFEIISNEARTRIAIVDYAHTPDALMNVLSSIREIPHSRLITIFGCGGDRDKTKRPVMAGISEKFSDFVIITSDNPRTEDPEKIIDDIEKGFSNEFNAYFRTPDRRAAIRKGVSMLPDGGFLLVAGKGHEEYQINGKKKEPFSDREEIQIAFAIPDLSRK